MVELYQVLGFVIMLALGYSAVPLAINVPWFLKPSAVVWWVAMLIVTAVYWPTLTP